jgi:hypothetical protein
MMKYTIHSPANAHACVPEHLWLVHGKLYDMTTFASQHPGGERLILLGRGLDATALVESYHALADRAKVHAALASCFVRDALPKELPPEAEALEWSESGFYRTLARRVAAALPPRSARADWHVIARLTLQLAVTLSVWTAALCMLLTGPLLLACAYAVGAALPLCGLLGALHEAGHGALLRPRAGHPLLDPNTLAANAITALTGLSNLVFAEAHATLHHPYPNLPGVRDR